MCFKALNCFLESRTFQYVDFRVILGGVSGLSGVVTMAFQPQWLRFAACFFGNLFYSVAFALHVLRFRKARFFRCRPMDGRYNRSASCSQGQVREDLNLVVAVPHLKHGERASDRNAITY